MKCTPPNKKNKRVEIKQLKGVLFDLTVTHTFWALVQNCVTESIFMAESGNVLTKFSGNVYGDLQKIAGDLNFILNG